MALDVQGTEGQSCPLLTAAVLAECPDFHMPKSSLCQPGLVLSTKIPSSSASCSEISSFTLKVIPGPGLVFPVVL